MSERDLSFKRNTIYNVCYKVINILFPFVINVYTTRILLAYGVGKVASIQNIVAYFSISASLGLPNYGIKAIARARKNDTELNVEFNRLFTINIISTTVALLIFLMVVNFNTDMRNEVQLYYVAGMAIVLNYINIDWLYYGIEKFKYITIRSFTIKIVSLLLMFLLVRTRDDYMEYLLVTCLATAGNNIFNVLHLKTYGIHIKIDLHFGEHIKPIFILFLTTISIELYTLLDITMLNIWCQEENIGYYTTASKAIKIVISFMVSLGGALLPRLSTYYSNGEHKKCVDLINKVFKVLFFVAIPAGVGWWFVSPDIIPIIYGSSFTNATITSRILSALIYFLTFSNLFGTQILLTVNAEWKLFFSTLCGMIINVILNVLLIPQYMQNGAAIASVVSEMTVTIMTFIFAKHYFDIRLEKRFVVQIIAGTLLMLLGIFFCDKLISESVLKVLVMMLGGVFVYGVSEVILKNEVLKILIAKK